ncbi:hypothetical protein EVAR_70380_1, partial [Eumeta japonica]
MVEISTCLIKFVRNLQGAGPIRGRPVSKSQHRGDILQLWPSTQVNRRKTKDKRAEFAWRERGCCKIVVFGYPSNNTVTFESLAFEPSDAHAKSYALDTHRYLIQEGFVHERPSYQLPNSIDIVSEIFSASPVARRARLRPAVNLQNRFSDMEVTWHCDEEKEITIKNLHPKNTY